MDKIKRFSSVNPLARMHEYVDGDYVAYVDHQAEVTKLQKQIEALKAEIKNRDWAEAVEAWDNPRHDD